MGEEVPILTSGPVPYLSDEAVLTYSLIAYFIGSIPFGLILSKIFGYGDIRKIGSGNIGATNVLRTGNHTLALATLFADVLKGMLAVYAVFIPLFFILLSAEKNVSWYNLIGNYNAIQRGYIALHIIGLFAIIGHCFPVWLKFKGGKGVATAFGVLIAAVPFAALVAATTWGIVAGFFRYSSLAALSAAAIAPLATLLIYGSAPAVITLLITLLIFARHKDNIKRLMAGEESKIGQKKEEQKDKNEPATPSE